MTRSWLASQQPRELSAFIELLRTHNVRSYLEVGARHGDTFCKIVKSLPHGSTAVAVDLPQGPWGGAYSQRHLKSYIEELNKLGYLAQCFFGNSQEIEVPGTFDAIFIDADHRYEAVKADWERYKDKGKIIAFHDIAAKNVSCGKYKVEVHKLWDEIKNDYIHKEFIMPDDDRPMGIGVLLERR